jgi:NAD(P)-binding Rossmann-like domain
MEPVDVVIVGAGISGIAAAWYVQRELPGKSFAVLDARDAVGGTWDLFRYPGIRSDSDLHTFGFAFKPWTSDYSIAGAHEILAYLNEAVDENGLRDRIRFGKRVTGVSWSSTDARWTVRTRDASTGELWEIECGFLFAGTGYYDYAGGYTPFCRLLQHMDATGMDVVVPVADDPTLTRLPLLDFESGYVQRALDRLPKRGSHGPWTVEMSYEADRARLIDGPVDDPALQFSSPRAPVLA